jgi:dihydroorotate dehydrogenase
LIGLFDRLARPFLRLFEPENAHALTLHALKLAPKSRHADDARLAVRVCGLNFKNPVGLAPGFDKNAEAADALLGLGFGFVEVGTVTPLPQPGNPRPRVFRLDDDEAIINRLGFNSAGATHAQARLAARGDGIVGVNIGANKNSIDRTADYIQLIEKLSPVASYITVNVSSPNTPGLRDLQRADALDELLARIVAARNRMRERAGPTPVLLKIAPDLTLNDLDDVVGIARSRRIDGMIVGNTTISRPQSLRNRNKSKESGGLSGRPLFPLSTRMLAETYVRVEGAFPLIGAGGIDSGEAALGKVRAGADLLQLYSALVFRGLGLLDEIKQTLLGALEREGTDHLSDLVGTDAAAVTAEDWPN